MFKLQSTSKKIIGLIINSMRNQKKKMVILADAALSSSQKRTILTQECLRRLRNTKIELGKEIQIEHLNIFMLKLKDSGYSVKYRAEILDSAFNAFEKLVDNSCQYGCQKKCNDLRNAAKHLRYPTKMCLGPKIEIFYFLIFPSYFSEFPLYILGAVGYGCVIDINKSG